MTNTSDVVVIASAEARPEKGKSLNGRCAMFLMIIADGLWAPREDHQEPLQGAHLQELTLVMADSAKPSRISRG